MKKSSLIKGTIILTAAGLLTRLIGFLYRIYLSSALGAEQLGVYQLVFPVYGICHTIYSSGIQTAVSKLTSEIKASDKNTGTRGILLRGICLSVTAAVLVSLLLFFNADRVALGFLKEASCAPSLRILALVFPFCGITGCINGYCYGKNRAALPAYTQVAEQLARVFGVIILAITLGGGMMAVSCELAVFGIVIGEITSNIISLSSLLIPVILRHRRRTAANRDEARFLTGSQKLSTVHQSHTFKRLLIFACPLTLNRLLLSILHSYEAILIPFLLRRSGLSSSEALSQYGILNGMALPFVYFASALTNALAVLLLPSISEDDARKNKQRIASTAERSICATLLLGIFCNVLFLCFGAPLGSTVFHEEAAGIYLRILSCLCPFLYLTTTLSSILNGLGKTGATFFTSMTGSLIRIGLLVFLVPRFGMTACFTALLFGQLVLCALELILVYYHTGFHLSLPNTIIKPILISGFTGFLLYRLYHMMLTFTKLPQLPLLLTFCAVFLFLYIALLAITGCLTGVRKAHNAS